MIQIRNKNIRNYQCNSYVNKANSCHNKLTQQMNTQVNHAYDFFKNNEPLKIVFENKQLQN